MRGGDRKAHDREKFSKIGTEIPLLPSKKTFSPLQLQNAKGPASNRRVNLDLSFILSLLALLNVKTHVSAIASHLRRPATEDP